MGQYREYNPKMEQEWNSVPFPLIEEDRRWETNSWGRQFQTMSGFKERRDVSVTWCDGAMIHGRFSYSEGMYGCKFFFKSKKDAMTFKLTFG